MGLCLRVRSVVQNPEGLLRLDMFARVAIPTKEQQQAIAVPVDAIQQIDGQAAVFVRESETRFKRQNVQLGLQAGNMVEIKAGLKGGETIVGTGSFYFKTALLRELTVAAARPSPEVPRRRALAMGCVAVSAAVAWSLHRRASVLA